MNDYQLIEITLRHNATGEVATVQIHLDETAQQLLSADEVRGGVCRALSVRGLEVSHSRIGDPTWAGEPFDSTPVVSDAGDQDDHHEIGGEG